MSSLFAVTRFFCSDRKFSNLEGPSEVKRQSYSQGGAETGNRKLLPAHVSHDFVSVDAVVLTAWLDLFFSGFKCGINLTPSQSSLEV